MENQTQEEGYPKKDSENKLRNGFVVILLIAIILAILAFMILIASRSNNKELEAVIQSVEAIEEVVDDTTPIPEVDFKVTEEENQVKADELSLAIGRKVQEYVRTLVIPPPTLDFHPDTDDLLVNGQSYITLDNLIEVAKERKARRIGLEIMEE